MKDLNNHVRKNGFDYYQEIANENGYVYRQMDGEKLVSFEVFKKKENTQFNCISFPGNEAFGTWAWTYRNLEDAKKRLETFNKKENG